MEILIVFGTGVVCGLYLATQIKKNIFKNITLKKKQKNVGVDV